MPKAMTGNRPKGLGCLVVFLGVFIVAGLGATALATLGPIKRVVRARSWTPALCTIVSSELRHHPGDGSGTYDVEVHYTWPWPAMDQSFEGSRYDLMGGSDSRRGHWQSIVDGLRPGMAVPCWVDPANPAEATLVREMGAGELAVRLLPLVLVVIPVLVLRRLFRKGVPRVRVPGPAAVFVVEPGPVALKPASTPRRRLAKASFAASFWNAVVWLALGPAAFGSGGGGFHWVLTAMFVLFAVVGAGLAFEAARALAALAAPRVRVSASARQLRPGERHSVDWTFRGRNRAISDVAVALVGSEIARAQRSDGDGTSTERYVRPFARFPIASLAGPAGSSGTGTLTIPEGIVPTFSAPNNQIAWAIVVEASLRHLPDLREEFPVVLLPGAR